MKRTLVVHTGRPLYSRKERGYAGDLAALARLRSALLSDLRFSSRSYQTASHHIAIISKMIAPFQKGKKGKTRTRGKPAR